MKKLFLVFLFIAPFVMIDSIAQNQSKLKIDVTFGFQEHDKRFWGNDFFQEEQNDWGTYQLGINLNRNILQKGKFSITAGLGLGQEVRNYQQPFDHCFDNPNSPCDEALRWIENYQIYLFQAPIQLNYNAWSNFDFGLLILTQFDYFKQVKSGNIKVSDFNVDLYSIEFSPTIGTNIGRWNINLGYRLFQFKTIDKVFLYGNNFLTKDPDYLDKTFDTFNPTKLFLTVGFKL
jgi:hypothetical protein